MELYDNLSNDIGDIVLTIQIYLINIDEYLEVDLIYIDDYAWYIFADSYIDDINLCNTIYLIHDW